MHFQFAEATRAVDEGRVIDQTGAPLHWQPADHVAAITNRARAWFAGDRYQQHVAHIVETTRFRVVD